MSVAQKDPAATEEPATPERLCFVMMPFTEWGQVYYQNIYEPAIEDAGLEPRKADSLIRATHIIKDIWEFAQSSEILLADLTGLNPNVMYELGLAHAIGQPVVLVTDSTVSIPFDLKPIRTVVYAGKHGLGGDGVGVDSHGQDMPSTLLAVCHLG